MKRELKAKKCGILRNTTHCHKAYPDEKGTESEISLLDQSYKRESQGISR